MGITIEAVEQYFERYGEQGWLYERLDSTTLVSGFQGEATTFQFFVKLSDEWVYFILVPFVSQPKGESKVRLFRYLLQLNYEMNMVKSGIDEDDDIFLAIELAASDLDYEHFSAALDTLSYYADKYYLPTLNLAIDSNYDPLSKE